MGRTTALGEAILLARQHKAPNRSTALLLVTDGRNTAGSADPLREAKQAAAAGIRLYTLGVGADPDTFAEAMTPAQAPAQSDPSAELDEALLQQLAEVGHGHYFRARTQGDLEAINQALDTWNPLPPRRPAIVQPGALPLAAGAGLAAAELARRLRWPARLTRKTALLTTHPEAPHDGAHSAAPALVAGPAALAVAGMAPSSPGPLLAPAMRAYLLPGQRRHFPWLWLACLPLILALSGPALRQQSQSIPSPALDIWLLDLSRSMLATICCRTGPPGCGCCCRICWLTERSRKRPIHRPHPVCRDAYLAMPPTGITRPSPCCCPTCARHHAKARQRAERAVALALKQIPAGQQARLLLITDDLTARQAERIKALWPCQGSFFCHAQVQARLDVLLVNSGQASRLPPP